MSESHDDLRAMAPGYVLAVLEADERRTFELHLTTCPECAAEVRAMSGAIDSARSGAAAPRMPAVTPARSWTSGFGWPPIAAMLLIALGAGIYGSHLHVETRLSALSERAESSDKQIAAVRRAAAEARSAMDVMAAPDVRRIDLEGRDAAATATGRALWSRQQGLVFARTNLPAPPRGRNYQVWIETAAGPISAGLLVEQDGGLAVFETAMDIPEPLGVSVTLEAAAGATAPTGTAVLVGRSLPLRIDN